MDNYPRETSRNRKTDTKDAVMKVYVRQLIGIILMALSILGVFTHAFGEDSMSGVGPSMRFFQKGDNKLIVYSDVPGAVPSKFYKIRVRSAGTEGVWQPVFANLTMSLYSEATHGRNGGDVAMDNYQKHLKDWSHTYGNIEMNGSVEVEVSRADGRAIKTAATHPAIRASKAEVKEGKAYFTLDKPALITVDIDGQMDEQNTGKGYEGPPINTVSLFAHPIFDKPEIGAPGVFVVKPGDKAPTDPKSYTTLYFSAGVHDIGRNFKVYANKQYFVPGDARVYGTMNNLGGGSGKNIKIFGVGTLSGDKIIHPEFDPAAKLPKTSSRRGSIESEWKSIDIENGENVVVEGVCVANPAFHAVHLTAKRTDEKKKTFARWAKVISWRANGDGIGSADDVEDCFLRCADDCSYIKGDRKRCVFWKDVNAAVFHMAGIPENVPIVIEDCDVIYLRRKDPEAGLGGVFVQRGSGPKGLHKVNVIARNIRIEDKFPSCAIFSMFSEGGAGYGKAKFKEKNQIGSSFSGITFQNITAAAESCSGRSNILAGSKEAPWNGGITFENVVIAGKKLISLKTFTTNEYVSGITFK